MPDELQLLEDDKKRESDPKLRTTLVEILLLLATTRPGREILRKKKVYPVVQKLHLQEQDEGVKDVIERLVILIQGDEQQEPSAHAVNKDLVIEEVEDDSDSEDEMDGKIEELL